MLKTFIHTSLAAVAVTVLSGCAGAAFNRVDMTLSRNITIGQELMDLQAAKEKGIINDSEYAEAKGNLLHMVEEWGKFKIEND